jgi:hypothetical protein
MPGALSFLAELEENSARNGAVYVLAALTSSGASTPGGGPTSCPRPGRSATPNGSSRRSRAIFRIAEPRSPVRLTAKW